MAQPAAPGYTGITTICTGFNTTLTATGAAGATFRWWDAPTGGNALSPNAAYTIPTINSVGTYHYYVEQTSFGITSLSRTDVAVTVNQTPTIVITPAGTIACAGSPTTLTATGASTYVWNTGSTTDTTIPAPATTTTYTVTGTSTLGCPATRTATISIFKTVAAGGNNQCYGYTSNLSASGAVTYTWLPGGFTGANISVSPTTTTLYTVTGSGNGCPTTDTVTVVVRPDIGVSAASGTTITEGSQVNLTCTSLTAVSYVWQPSQVGSTGTSIYVTPTQTTTYTVTGTDVYGCKDTATTTTTVIKLPAATGATAICQGNAATLTATGTAPFTWYTDSTTATALYTGATFVSPPVTANTSYWVAGNGGPRKEVRLTVAFPLTTATATPAIICGGDTSRLESPYLGLVKYYDAPTGGNLLDSSIIGNPAKFTPFTTTTYYAEGTQTPVTAVFAYTGAVQTWTVPAGVTSIDVDVFGSHGTSGTYGRANHGTGGRVQASMGVTPGQVLNIYVGGTHLWNGGGYAYNPFGGALGGDASDIRAGGTGLLNRVVVAGGGAGSGSPGGSSGVVNSNRGDGGGLIGQDGTTASNSGGSGGNNGTGGTQIAGGTGGSTPAAYQDPVTGTPGTFGNGGVAADFGGTDGGGGGGGWYGGGGGKNQGDGGGGSSYTNPQLCTNVIHTQGGWDYNGVIYIRYGGACNGSSARVPVTVTVMPTPTISSNLPATQAVCIGSPATFTVAATNTVSYQWRKNGANITGATTNSYTIPATTLTDTGTYSVLLANANGCTATSADCALKINVVPIVTVTASASACLNAAAGTVAFTATGNSAPYTFFYNINGGPTQTVTTNTAPIRYVRVQQNGGDYMHFAELRAIQAGTGNNVAAGKTGTGTTDPANPVTNLTDSSLSNFWHSTGQGTSQYVEVDLGAAYMLDHIELVNRLDCCQQREQNVQLILKDNNGAVSSSQQIDAYQNQNTNYTTAWPVIATNALAAVNLPVPTATAGAYQYNLTNVTGTGGCATPQSGTATITVSPYAMVTASPVAAQTLCAGSPLTLSVTASNAITYQWFKNGTALTGATGGNFTIPAVAVTNAGTYKVIAIGGGGCNDSSATGSVVTVTPSATATISGSASVCQNAMLPNITFSGTGTTPPYTFSYTLNGGAVQTISTTGASSSVILPVPTGAAGAYQYSLASVAGTTGCSSTTTGSAIVTVNAKAMITASPAATQALCAGSALALSITASNAATYKWLKNGAAITGATASAFSIPTTAVTDSGTYRAIAINASGCNDSSSNSVVTVSAAAIATISGTTTLCGANNVPQNIVFTAAGTMAPYTFSYNVNGGATQTLSTGSGRIRYIRIQQNANTYTDYMTLAEIRAIQAGTGTNVAAGKSGTGTTLSGYPITNMTDGNNGTYWISAAFGNTQYVELDLGAAYSLDRVELVTAQGFQSRAQNLQLILKDSSSAVYSSQQIDAYQNQNSVAYTTLWPLQFSDTIVVPATTLGTYQYNLLGVTGGAGCGRTYTTSATVTYGAPSGVTASPVAAQALCIGNPLLLNVTATNAAAYQWVKNGTAIPGATAATFSIPAIAATDIGTYKVISSSNSGCSDTSAGSVVTLNTAPTATISGTAATCQNYAPVNLTLTGSGTPPYQFTYNVNGGPNQTINSGIRAARYVRLQQNNNANYMVLSEVEAIEAGTGINVALNKPETITGTPGTVTTVTDGSYSDYIFTPGAFSSPAAVQFCEIDLGAVYNLSSIKITTYSGCCQSNQSGIILTLKDSTGNQVSTQTVNAYQNVAAALTTTWPAAGNTQAMAILPAPTTVTGTYQYNLVNVSYAGNCVSNQSGTATVTVHAAPTITVQPVSSMAVCTTFPIELDAASSSPTDTYQWQVGGVNIPGETDPTYINYYANLTDSGKYRILVTNTAGCTSTSTLSAVTVGTFNNTLATTNATTTGIQSDGMDLTYTDPNCKLIADVADPAGGNVLGTVNIAVNFDATVQSFNGFPYLQRHLDIQPASDGPATVKLYVRQQDFTAYNTYVSSHGNTVPLLPTGPTDAAGISHIVISQFHGAASAGNTGPGGQYAAANSQTISGSALSTSWGAGYWTITMPVTGFSGFFIGSYSITPLAIDLKDISAENVGRTNNVNWTTATEADGDYFEVERSLDGVAYTQIGTVKGKAKSGADYVYTDEQPATGINYYRLRLMDAAGTGHYSKTVSASVKAGSLVLQVYPNPTSDVLTIHSTGAAGDKATITLTDLSGKTVLSTVMTGNETTISMNGLAAGLYLLHYADDAFHQTVKVTKE